MPKHEENQLHMAGFSKDQTDVSARPGLSVSCPKHGLLAVSDG